MMRKDVRIGFAIGGVLLAVLIVYGLVTSGPQNDEVTLAPDTSTPANANGSKPANGSAPAPGGNGAAPAGQTDPFLSGGSAQRNGSAPGDATTGSGPAPAGGNGNDARPAAETTKQQVEDKWTHALNTGKLELMVTQTPEPPNAAPQSPQNTAPPSNGTGTTPNGNGNDAPGPSGTSTVTTPDTTSSSSPPGGSATGGATGNAAGFNAADLTAMATTPATQPTGAGTSATGSTGAPGQRTHTVQPGETFASIAEVAYGSESYYPHLLRANPTVNPKRLRAGMTIVLPDRDQVVAVTNPADAAQLAGNTTPGAPAPAAALPALDEKTQYRVLPGDSLHKISTKLYGKIDRVDPIYELNKDLIGPDPARLKAGVVLKLPEPPTRTPSAR